MMYRVKFPEGRRDVLTVKVNKMPEQHFIFAGGDIEEYHISFEDGFFVLNFRLMSHPEDSALYWSGYYELPVDDLGRGEPSGLMREETFI